MIHLLGTHSTGSSQFHKPLREQKETVRSGFESVRFGEEIAQIANCKWLLPLAQDRAARSLWRSIATLSLQSAIVDRVEEVLCTPATCLKVRIRRSLDQGPRGRRSSSKCSPMQLTCCGREPNSSGRYQQGGKKLTAPGTACECLR